MVRENQYVSSLTLNLGKEVISGES